MSELDDLARAMVRPDGEDVGRAQAVIRSWNPDTFRNTVDYDGLLVEDVPVKAGIEALAYQAGQVVQLELWHPGGKQGERGLGTPTITGVSITPGEGAAEKVIAALRTNIAKQLSAEIFTERIAADVVFTLDNFGDTSSSWVDLSTAGPAVADVEISSTGLALVLHGCEIGMTVNSTNLTARGLMSFEVTGDTTLPPGQDDVRIAQLGQTLGSPGSLSLSPNANVMTASWVALNEGTHTFTAKYQGVTSAGGNWITAQRRFMVVVGF